MHVEPNQYAPEVLADFWSFVDQGKALPRPMTLADSELFWAFHWLGLREKEWLKGFQEGLLLPQDFKFCDWQEDFETARRIDTLANGGYERTIWRLLQGC